MVSRDDHIYINSINQLDMILSRFLVRGKFDNMINIMNETNKYFSDNQSKHNSQVVAEALEILIYHYGELHSKIPGGCEHGKVIDKYLRYYMEEKKKIKLTA